MIRPFVLTVVISLTLTAIVAAQQGPQTQVAQTAAQQPTTQPIQDVSLDEAQRVVLAAAKKAADLKLKQNIAVVDSGGSLKAFIRMDGAWLGSIDIAIKKAKTSRLFDMPTGELGKLSKPGGPLYMIEITNHGLVSFPGGVPLKRADGTVVGAIGVSGSTVDNDNACAEAGAAAFK